MNPILRAALNRYAFELRNNPSRLVDALRIGATALLDAGIDPRTLRAALATVRDDNTIFGKPPVA